MDIEAAFTGIRNSIAAGNTADVGVKALAIADQTDDRLVLMIFL